VLLSVENLARMEHPAFPFTDQGKDLGYTREREREKEEREKTKKKRALGLHRPSPQAGPPGPTDNNGSMHVL
jgi:hypothetical protein